jgi:hypothetical protein
MQSRCFAHCDDIPYCDRSKFCESLYVLQTHGLAGGCWDQRLQSNTDRCGGPLFIVSIRFFLKESKNGLCSVAYDRLFFVFRCFLFLFLNVPCLGIALGLGLRNEALIECIKMAPINMHDTICSMLIRRGCATEALALTGLSFDRLIECIVRFDLKQNAIEVFESIARSEYLSLDSPSSAITLLLYLAHSGLLPGGRSAYAGFVKRYARCHDDVSLALLHESIIASKRAGTKTIELPPVFSGLLSDIII